MRNTINERPICCLLMCLVLGLVTDSAIGQEFRLDQGWYVQPRTGLTFYTGDQGDNVFKNPVGGGLAVELGYQTTVRWALGVTYQFANYPRLSSQFLGPTRRQSVQATARYAIFPNRRFSPYMQTGIHLTLNRRNDDADAIGYGPVFGLGLDVPLSRSVSLFVESSANVVLPDSVADGGDNGAPFDVLGFVTASVRYSFKPVCRAVEIRSVEVPESLETYQNGLFTATTNAATPPVRVRWDFGDGTAGQGLTTTHRYVGPDTVRVRIVAANCGGIAEQETFIAVTDPCVPADIRRVTLHHSAERLSENPVSYAVPDTVRFFADVTGTPPLCYRWDFGDNSPADTMASPTHVYFHSGSYRARLAVENCEATQVGERAFVILPGTQIPEPRPQLETAYFGFDSTRPGNPSLLQMNADSLKANPLLQVRIDAYTDSVATEKYNCLLSLKRALIVEQYYRSQGIAESRLYIVAHKETEETCSGCPDMRETKADDPGCACHRLSTSTLIDANAVLEQPSDACSFSPGDVEEVRACVKAAAESTLQEENFLTAKRIRCGAIDVRYLAPLR